jgi:hypothetical protein
MGADIYLQSIWSRTPPLPVPVESGGTLVVAGILPRSGEVPLDQMMQAFFDEARASGGYFRNGYNAGDVMWAMGLSWQETVRPMLNQRRYLPVKRARELVEIIEARPLTRERVAAHIFEHMTDGVEPHPVTGGTMQMMEEAMAAAAGVKVRRKRPPDVEVSFRFLNARREELLTILRKSIELGEPLYCEL